MSRISEKAWLQVKAGTIYIRKSGTDGNIRLADTYVCRISRL
jgi:hypothetical protein